MKIDQLNYFLETAKHEHIGKAAKILAISPSAISHSISSLEQELGRDLFIKQGKNIFLTAHGKLLKEKSEKILKEIFLLKDQMSSDSIELEGTYRLAATHVLSGLGFLDQWLNLMKNNPKLHCEIFSLRSAEVVHGVSEGQYDMGMCFSPQASPQLQIEPLLSGKLLICVRKGHPVLAIPDVQQLKATQSYQAILPKAYNGIDVCEEHSEIKDNKIVPTIQMSFDHYEIGVKAVAATDCWGFFPCSIVEQYKEIITPICHPENWNSSYSISLIWQKKRILSRPLLSFIEKMKKEAYPQGQTS